MRPWTVELTRDASDAVRGLPPVVRRAFATLMEELVEGPPTRATVRDAASRLHSVALPDLRVDFVVRPQERSILVIAVVEATRGAAPPRFAGLFAAVSELAADVRYAVRGLRRAPAFTFAVVATLAVGLGGTTAIFGLTDTVFRGRLPFRDDDRLVRILSEGVRADGARFQFNVAPRDFHLVRDGSVVLEDVMAMRGWSVALLGDGPAERASVIGVTAGWADLLGLRPHLGRVFTADEEALGEEAGVALISHGLWERRFGGDRSVLGTELDFDGGSFVVVGVLGPRFSYPYDADIWTPWIAGRSNWTGSDLNVVGRLREGEDIDGARADLNRLYAALKGESPGVAPNEGIAVRSVRDDFIRDHARALNGLTLAVVFLLLLVCVNVASLFTARMVARRREVALRAALGAGRARILRAAVLESVLLFLAGAGVGVGLVLVVGDAASALVPDVMRTQLDLGRISVDGSLVGFAALLALVAGGATGALSALQVARVDLQTVLRSGGRGQVGAGGGVRDGLVIVELALSLVLLVGAGVLAEHSERLRRADLGFDTDGLSTVQLPLQSERYADAQARIALIRTLEEEIAAIPGVRGVGLTSVNPVCCGNWGARLRVEGLERAPDAPPLVIHHRYVTPDYFPTMGIPLVRGRVFDDRDRPGAMPVVIVDQDLADRLWPGENPLGKRLGWDLPDAPLLTVVGVSAGAFAEGDERETWYLPFYQDPTGRSNEIVHLMIRSETDAPLASVRAVAGRVDPSLAVFGAATMDALRQELIAQDRVGAVIATLFGVAGLVLAGLGLYGLLAYQVELRRRELGTRIALGAGRGDVVSMVLRGTARLFAVGAGIGAFLAFGLNDLLTRVVDGVRYVEPSMFAGLLGLLGLAVLSATLAPTLRAVRVDPAKVLQAD